MQVERREGYELQLVMVMATGCQWDGATLALKSQQPVMSMFMSMSFLFSRSQFGKGVLPHNIPVSHS